MSQDASAIFRSQVHGYSELERLSAVETLRGLKHPDTVSLDELQRYLQARGLWSQFAKITLGDLRDAFTEVPVADTNGARKRKRRILEDELEEAYAEKAEKEEKDRAVKTKAPDDGGLSTEEVARDVMPFVEGNGDVTLDDIAEYTRLDRKVLRHHLGALVKEGRLERIGTGRHAVYSAL